MLLTVALVTASAACRSLPEHCVDDVVESVRSTAEATCETRGEDCESGRYVRCVNREVAAAAKRGDLPAACRHRAEVNEARCRQLLMPNYGYVE